MRCFVFGLWPDKSVDFSNLWSPRRVHAAWAHGAITVGIVTVIFSMVGAEIATIAAAESSDPEKAVAKAANSVILRILIFYVGSVFLLVTILPWNDEGIAASPFVAAFTKMGIPYADHIMNAVVLTAVLSCLNSGMYTASRMLFVLAARREAPAAAGERDPSRGAGQRDPDLVGDRLPVRDRRGRLAETPSSRSC